MGDPFRHDILIERRAREKSRAATRDDAARSS
jgi:hypothetical protein